MNSVVQCLGQLRPMLEYFFARSHLADIKASGRAAHVTKEFADLIVSQWSRVSYNARRPARLKRFIVQGAPQFAGMRQHDAQEFLVYLLNALHDDLNRGRARSGGPGFSPPANASEEELCTLHWEHYSLQNSSPIQELFCGQLLSTVRCSACGHVSRSCDPFWDLSLPLVRGTDQATPSLQRAMQAFFAEELLTGAERFKCPKCKTHQDATKRMLVSRWPRGCWSCT